MTEEVAVETVEPEVELTPEQKRARQRALAQQAIGLAMQSRWEESLAANQQILELFPSDPEASNRIGNAMSELNRIPEAIEAYERTLDSQPTNPIAQRNLLRLQRIAEAGDVGAKASQKLAPAFFVEEVGKTGITALTELAGPEAISRVAAGDEVQLNVSKGDLEAVLPDGTYLGKVEHNLAERLTRLMKTGNEYQAGVVMAEPGRLRILVRETVLSPDNEGRISFPPKTAAVRAYTRETLLRRGADEDEELEGEAADVESDEIEDDEENPAEFGFSETSMSGDSEGA
jgi:tetratricopeptide (TPR) repeat protein